jgi:predicted DNA-binding antitoxin AbrB/MazE fold protein
MTAIHAVYENGVFVPKQPVSLPEGAEVTVEVTPPTVEVEESALEREIRWLTSRTPEEILTARERLEKISRPPTPLPPGKTLPDMVEGKWPGDETDEQIREALEKLS